LAPGWLSRDFVTVKLDSDRGIGAKDIAKRYIDKEQGLPWFAFLDANGNCLIHSTRPEGGNIGHPVQPDEIAYFKTMLERATMHLTNQEIDDLVRSLEGFNKAEGIHPVQAQQERENATAVNSDR
jgi:hypothetical protein